MNLYEVTNDHFGESYVRVYVWCENEQSALEMADGAFRKAGYNPGLYTLKATFLFSQTEMAFVTRPSDSGWDN